MMDNTALVTLLEQLAGNFSAWRLFWAGCVGVLLGGGLGILLCIGLSRSGWLARRRRWHHYLLKLYFLALPCCGALIGMQAALYVNAERQVKERIDEARVDVQRAADSVRADFESYLVQAELPVVNGEHSVEDILGLLVADYLKDNPLSVAALEEDGVFERAALKGFEMFRTSLLTRLVSDQLVKQAAKHTGVSEDTLKRVVSTRFSELFSADFALDLAKRQVSSLMFGFYLAVALQLVLLLLLVAGECLLAHQLRWRPEPDPVAPSTALAAG